jgi:hypothetical protein
MVVLLDGSNKKIKPICITMTTLRSSEAQSMVYNNMRVSVSCMMTHLCFRDLSIEEDFDEGRKRNASDDELFQPYQDKRLTPLPHSIILSFPKSLIYWFI